ncbi:MAG: hypothetical protein KatS3mg104_2597 [Phycisphaerae bacterium]|nr:MAG: hypothetical protein KatS3mg104_2597 [Phycisphaerae bacterium]
MMTPEPYFRSNLMSDDLKTHVSASLAVQWDDFAQRHPRLSRVIDQHLLVEQAVSYLRLNPDYQRAMVNAQSAGADLETLLKLVDKYLAIFLEKLI